MVTHDEIVMIARYNEISEALEPVWYLPMDTSYGLRILSMPDIEKYVSALLDKYPDEKDSIIKDAHDYLEKNGWSLATCQGLGERFVLA